MADTVLVEQDASKGARRAHTYERGMSTGVSAPFSRLLTPRGEHSRASQCESRAQVRCFPPSQAGHCVTTGPSKCAPRMITTPCSPVRTLQNFLWPNLHKGHSARG